MVTLAQALQYSNILVTAHQSLLGHTSTLLIAIGSKASPDFRYAAVMSSAVASHRVLTAASKATHARHPECSIRFAG